MVVSSAPAFSQDVNSAFAAAGKQSGIAYVHVKDVPSDVWSAISQKAKLAASKRGRKPELIANAYTNERANSLNQLRSACEKHELAPATDF